MDSSTPLILAATHGYSDIVNMLASAGCDLDQRNLEGIFPVDVFLTFSGKVQSKKCNINFSSDR